jgi:hypothetical protein
MPAVRNGKTAFVCASLAPFITRSRLLSQQLKLLPRCSAKEQATSAGRKGRLHMKCRRLVVTGTAYGTNTRTHTCVDSKQLAILPWWATIMRWQHLALDTQLKSEFPRIRLLGSSLERDVLEAAGKAVTMINGDQSPGFRPIPPSQDIGRIPIRIRQSHVQLRPRHISSWQIAKLRGGSNHRLPVTKSKQLCSLNHVCRPLLPTRAPSPHCRSF